MSNNPVLDIAQRISNQLEDECQFDTPTMLSVLFSILPSIVTACSNVDPSDRHSYEMVKRYQEEIQDLTTNLIIELRELDK